jgi:hypothetical protein
MTLFFFLPFAVYITGHVGNFRHSEQVIATVFDIHQRYPELFPAPRLLSEYDVKGKQPESEPKNLLSRPEFCAKYDEIQSFAGIISSWRPRKHLKSRNTSDRGQVLLWFQSLAVVMISWVAAFLLSYMTPTWGLGCRSGSWTVITIAWLVSAFIDFTSQWLSVDVFGKEVEGQEKRLTKKAAQVLWWMSMVKDLLITFSILTLIGLSQVGYFNTCWCMASMFFRPSSKMDQVCIDLGPVQQQDRDQDWVRWLLIPIVALISIHAVIFWAGWEGEGGRLLYLRTKTERQAEDIALENMSQRLYIPRGGSDQYGQPSHSRQDNDRTSTACSGSELPRHRLLNRRHQYGALPTDDHELQNIAESSRPNSAMAPPRPSLSPGRRVVSQELGVSYVPSGSGTPPSEARSSAPLLPSQP